MSSQKIEGVLYSNHTPVSIEISEGKIASIKKNKASKSNNIIGPGLIDNQVNGYNGIGFTDADLSIGGVKQVILEMYKQGVTTFLPTLITMPLDLAKRNLAIIAEVAKDLEWGTSIPGIHMEGPYISAEEGYRGAHKEYWIKDPDWDEFCALNEAADGLIRQITLAPERPGAINFIEKCSQNGIVVGIGHHNANPQQIADAVNAGARISTHLGNACANYIHRHNNPLWPQLAEDHLMASIIADGIHLNCNELLVFLRAKGSANLVLISDITKMAGLPVGEHDWDGQKIIIKNDGSVNLAQGDVLAGSSKPLHSDIIELMTKTKCSMAEAIDMASINPARLNKLTDRGNLSTGMNADIIIFQPQIEKFEILQTFSKGRQVYSRKQ